MYILYIDIIASKRYCGKRRYGVVQTTNLSTLNFSTYSGSTCTCAILCPSEAPCDHGGLPKLSVGCGETQHHPVLWHMGIRWFGFTMAIRSGVGSPQDPADLRWYDDNFVGTELNKGTAVGHQMVWLVSYGHYGHTEPSPMVDRGHPVARRGICGDGQGLWPEGREGWQCLWAWGGRPAATGKTKNGWNLDGTWMEHEAPLFSTIFNHFQVVFQRFWWWNQWNRLALWMKHGHFPDLVRLWRRPLRVRCNGRRLPWWKCCWTRSGYPDDPSEFLSPKKRCPKKVVFIFKTYHYVQ